MPEEQSLLSLVHWSPLHLLIPVVIVQRLLELRRAKHNTEALLKKGAVEFGQDHYPAMVVVHTLWFVGMLVEIIILSRPISPFWYILLLIFLAAQILRYWTIRTLGSRWSTRVLVLPGAKAITGGPFRYVRHPNYIAVTIELLTLPLLYSAYITAIVAGILYGILLRVRIRAEEQGLKEVGIGYDAVGKA